MNNKNYDISFIRLIATTLIITCHIFQYQNNELAWWFNVGVQIFLFMSGYLYGQKEITNCKAWYKSRFKKILTPYYVYIGIVSIVYFIFFRDLFNIRSLVINILNLQYFKTGITGLSHLWFITFIIICYLITPILQEIYNNYSSKNEFVYWCQLGVLILYLQALNYVGFINISVANLSCYILGYFISRRYIYAKNKDTKNMFNIGSVGCIFVLIAICSNAAKIIMKYKLYMYGKYSISLFYDYAHSLLGIGLFFALMFLFYIIRNTKNKIIVLIADLTDRYSFTIFIAHQIYILGKFSLLDLTNNIYLNIAIALIVILFSGVILNLISENIIRKYIK